MALVTDRELVSREVYDKRVAELEAALDRESGTADALQDCEEDLHVEREENKAIIGRLRKKLQGCERERARLFTETEGPAGLREQAADLRLEIKFREAAEQRVKELEVVARDVLAHPKYRARELLRLRSVLAASPPLEEQDD